MPCGGPTAFTLCYASIRYSAFGVGLMPLSIRAQTPAARRLSLSLRVDGGAVWFTQRIPAESGTRFNFTGQASADVELRVTPRSWALIGYRHVHLSNGDMGEVNVGVDANLFTVGLQWW